ncbi:ATP-binding protein [Roseomonas marmotae]|uniref:ATP-binding protein n=1 Tax=Roseomonas marmotae TaxID=2768161 RepID=UPI001F00A424|nr:ATP-binding protein [Roseomonas marmotae]
MPDQLRAPHPGPVLILTPTGRDAGGAARLLGDEGIDSIIHPSLGSLQDALDDRAGLVLMADEALFRADLTKLTRRIAEQPPWSDLPFIILTRTGIAARRKLAEMKLPDRLGNLLFLERPLNAMSLISAVRTALRARQRQRQVREYLAERVGAAERVATLLDARVQERTAALKAAEEERHRIATALAQSQKMEAVGQLTGGLAHDFNNMLAGVIGSLDLLQIRLAQGRTEQLDRYIGMARMGAERAAALTHRLLAFSRRQTLEPKPTDLNHLIHGMIELIRSTIGPEIEIVTDLHDALWPTLCDPHQLENALLNLCINARDAMPAGGRLVIGTGHASLTSADTGASHENGPGDYATLCVSDTGTGMSPEVIARAFDPFFTTKPLGQGTGLGLSMIYGFIQQSGGHIRIDSRPERGTRVTLQLPRYHGTVDAALGGDGARIREDVAARGSVLVVDDEPAVRMLVAEVLADLGYHTLEAHDGPSGLRALRASGRVDLLVTDVGMPGGMNGRHLADAARVEQPDLRILFITGYAENALIGSDRLEQGMHVLTKPFSMEALTTRIRAITMAG